MYCLLFYYSYISHIEGINIIREIMEVAAKVITEG